VQREQERESVKARQKAQEDAKPKQELNVGQKRKRSDVDEADPKLKEFLEVMQPPSKSKAWASQAADNAMDEPPTKIQAMEVPDGESDEEYEVVPKKTRQKSPPKVIAAAEPLAQPRPTVIEETVLDSTAPDATDDDWLRGRTNRLLDLMDPEDIPAGMSSSVNTHVPAAADSAEELLEPMEVEETTVIVQDEEINVEKPDPTIEAIRSNGRLFVRNLPYSASEDDLKKHFEPYGSLEEVRYKFRYLFLPYAFMMNIQIGTAYAYEHVM
jgi:multiple RNA-binding domain-containing protein 1